VCDVKFVVNAKNVQWFCHGIVFYSSIGRTEGRPLGRTGSYLNI
jgi:hypothetical protein